MIAHPVARARSYVLVWLALIGLLVVTLASAYVPLGWANSAINLAIAVAKALLVAFFFMHLRSAHYMLRIAAMAGFFWLAILIGLSLTDFAIRY
ncbi:MAG TPA: cytochrome C oxidase subunit IV family protein [Casimicrobiaceae bacterium]|jgi:cytochrome c oxidase subunit 4|nr:cytochrome C oxidase subunit IV family protein [Casimicrobiaceae bacterium]